MFNGTHNTSNPLVMSFPESLSEPLPYQFPKIKPPSIHTSPTKQILNWAGNIAKWERQFMALCIMIWNRTSLFDFCAIKLDFLEMGSTCVEQAGRRKDWWGIEDLVRKNKGTSQASKVFYLGSGFQEMGIREFRRTHAIKQRQSRLYIGWSSWTIFGATFCWPHFLVSKRIGHPIDSV